MKFKSEERINEHSSAWYCTDFYLSSDAGRNLVIPGINFEETP
jgi:hypothetical protein